MLDSVYHVTMKFKKYHIFGVKRHYITLLKLVSKTSGLSILLHSVWGPPLANSRFSLVLTIYES